MFLTATAIICFLSAILYRDAIGTFFGNLVSTLKPVIYGIAIAYLLSPMERLFRKHIEKLFERSKASRFRKLKRLPKILSVLLTYVVFLLILTCFFVIVLPGIGKSVEDFASKLSEYYKICVDYISDPAFPLLKFPETEAKLMELVNQAYNIAKGLLPQVYTFVGGLFTEILHFIIGILISIYVLAGKGSLKKHCNRILCALFEEPWISRIKRFAYRVDRVFGGFISGKIFDSAIIGVICFAAMLLMKMPYATLISVLVGVTNVIPFFGPFIGAIPSAFIVLLAEPSKTVWFVIMIIALQQLDGNVIGPKILGETTGLPSFWVIFSLLLFGGFWGVFGMLIAVPTFALLYDAMEYFTEKRLLKKAAVKKADGEAENAAADESETKI